MAERGVLAERPNRPPPPSSIAPSRISNIIDSSTATAATTPTNLAAFNTTNNKTAKAKDSVLDYDLGQVLESSVEVDGEPRNGGKKNSVTFEDNSLRQSEILELSDSKVGEKKGEGELPTEHAVTASLHRKVTSDPANSAKSKHSSNASQLMASLGLDVCVNDMSAGQTTPNIERVDSDDDDDDPDNDKRGEDLAADGVGDLEPFSTTNENAAESGKPSIDDLGKIRSTSVAPLATEVDVSRYGSRSSQVRHSSRAQHPPGALSVSYECPEPGDDDNDDNDEDYEDQVWEKEDIEEEVKDDNSIDRGALQRESPKPVEIEDDNRAEEHTTEGGITMGHPGNKQRINNKNNNINNNINNSYSDVVSQPLVSVESQSAALNKEYRGDDVVYKHDDDVNTSFRRSIKSNETNSTNKSIEEKRHEEEGYQREDTDGTVVTASDYDASAENSQDVSRLNYYNTSHDVTGLSEQHNGSAMTSSVTPTDGKSQDVPEISVEDVTETEKVETKDKDARQSQVDKQLEESLEFDFTQAQMDFTQRVGVKAGDMLGSNDAGDVNKKNINDSESNNNVAIEKPKPDEGQPQEANHVTENPRTGKHGMPTVVREVTWEDEADRGRLQTMKVSPRFKPRTEDVSSDEDDDDDEEGIVDDYDSFGSRDIRLFQRRGSNDSDMSEPARGSRKFPMGVDSRKKLGRRENMKQGLRSDSTAAVDNVEPKTRGSTLHATRPISRSATDLRPEHEQRAVVAARREQRRPQSTQTMDAKFSGTEKGETDKHEQEKSSDYKTDENDKREETGEDKRKQQRAVVKDDKKKENKPQTTKGDNKNNKSGDENTKGDNAGTGKGNNQEAHAKGDNDKHKTKKKGNETDRSTRSTESPVLTTAGRQRQKEFFKLELQRLEAGLRRESSKIHAPPKKAYQPYVFNTLEPYYNTHTTRFLIELPDEVNHGHTSRKTAQGLTDPWLDLRMDRELPPVTPSKPVSRQVSILKREKELRERKKRHAATQSSQSRKGGSTRLPKFPVVQLETKDLATKQLYYSDVPALRHELKTKYSSSAKTKVAEDYERTHQDFYRMELDKLNEVHPINRKHMTSAYFAYLQNTPGSKKAITECVRGLKSGKA